MGLMGFLILGAIIMVAIGIWIAVFDPQGQSSIAQDLKNRNDGHLNAHMQCPHCNQVGHVRTKSVNEKKGVSGGKATAAVLTGGVSLLATGLSRKETLTRASCDHCSNTWAF